MADMVIPNAGDIESLVEKLAEQLLARGWTMATAESCTGGWIAKCCTDLAGSSQWFECGYVTYSNRAKQEMLGIESRVLEMHRAVSEETAIQMAQGAYEKAAVNAALSVTGVAGPAGGTDAKPVGAVWFAWSVEGRTVESELMQFQGDRDAVRRQTVAHALSGLLSLLQE